MKRVLFVLSTLNTGGAQKIISNIIMSLPQDWEIDILLNDAENIVYPYRGRIVSLDCRPEMDKNKLGYQIKVLAKRFFMIRKLKRHNHYQACISALTSANVVNVLTGKRFCKTILTVHSVTSREVIGRGKEKLLHLGVRFFYNKADKVVTVSRGSRQDLLEHFGIKPEKVMVIYNGYLIREIREKAAQELSAQEKWWFAGPGPYLAMAGRLEKEKAQWHVIRALKKIAQEYPSVRLLLLGEGRLRDYLRRLAQECGLEENVVFCGFCENPYRIMARCDGFVASSLYEGFSNVLVEALTCGVPCVATDFDCGAREILAPGTGMSEKIKGKYEKVKYGILCPVIDGIPSEGGEELKEEEGILADGILAMLRDSKCSQYYKEKGAERAAQFDMKCVIEEWIKVMIQ